jgi:DNA-binding transcriptional ArsR family regulator
MRAPRVSSLSREAHLVLWTTDGRGKGRKKEALLSLSSKGGRTASQILAAMEQANVSISQPTLSRRLAALQNERHVVVNGKGRNTTYELDNYNEYFDVPAERRKAVSYDRSILENTFRIRRAGSIPTSQRTSL